MKVSEMFKIIAEAVAYANSNASSKIYVCATPQDTTLAKTDYEALTWVEITGIGSRGEAGKQTNILTYDTWDQAVVQKAKGMTDAGTVPLELARDASDAGQIILRTASGVNQNYAFKEVRNDGTNGNTGTVIYNRGLVTGPTRPGGRNEDFDLEVFTLAFQQVEIVVDPLDGGNAPVLTVAPAITGTANTGEDLTVDNGTFTGDATITYEYQWFRGGTAIAGATSSTYTIVSADEGFVLTARVTATNDAGTAYGFSAATATVTAP